VPDLTGAYESWNVRRTSEPCHWFADDRHSHTIGRRLGSVKSSWSHHEGKIRRCLAAAEYGGVSSTPVNQSDVVVLVSGLQVPMVLLPTVTGFEMNGMAEVHGIMDGSAGDIRLGAEMFALV